MAMKYEHIGRGAKIRAYDFEPFPGRGECYIEGEVIGHRFERGVAWLAVACEVDVFGGKPGEGRVGQTVLVPQETFGEFCGEDTWERVIEL